jgi:hypothetical protein
VVRALKDRRRDGETERLGDLEVDHQLELGRLLDGQIGRLGAFEDLVDVVLRRRRDEALRGLGAAISSKAHKWDGLLERTR